MIDPDRLLDILDSTDLLKRGDSRLPSDLSATSRPDKILLENGLVDEKAMTRVIAEYLNISVANPSEFPSKAIEAGGANFAFLRQNRILPLSENDDSLTIAMADPFDETSLQSLKLLINKNVKVCIADKNDLDRAFDRLYKPELIKNAGTASYSNNDMSLKTENGPADKIFDELINTAINNNASDLHIEAFEQTLKTRYRIDGQLVELGNAPPNYISDMLISRVKIIGNLNVAEKRLPQDGRATIFVTGRQIDLRISSIPTINGESLVLRLLDPGNSPKNLNALNTNGENIRRLRKLLNNRSGMILTTGPTGSGKTTTLYAMLNEINLRSHKIITLEDPIEYRLDGVNQIQVNPSIGLHFSNLLRSVLRQDPDTIMVGEIRDVETARLAIQAALTGHLVISSLHTNTALGAVTRLIDMGIEPFLISAAVKGVIGQRLVKKLCASCKRKRKVTPPEAAAYGLTEDSFIGEPGGCSACHQTGYNGRIAIMEILRLDEKLRQYLLKNGNLEEFDGAVDEPNFKPYEIRDCIKMLQTSIDEITGQLNEF
ncbi:MAG: Flp pilus assembly complex ATPase component TadA [Nisaea sp.]|nr:Flp pilus assembly complex ATPase component TadA [Nisaea sp.]